jgi:hypothetical protein
MNKKTKNIYPHPSPTSLLSNTKCSLVHNLLSKFGVNLENLHPIVVRQNGNLGSHNMEHYKLTQIGINQRVRVQ